jgi:heme/copper-type cytochrome/quinol oxidase subunit 1
MNVAFKSLLTGLLIWLGIHGRVIFAGKTIDIHLHDTYYVIDISHVLFLFGL